MRPSRPLCFGIFSSPKVSSRHFISACLFLRPFLIITFDSLKLPFSYPCVRARCDMPLSFGLCSCLRVSLVQAIGCSRNRVGALCSRARRRRLLRVVLHGARRAPKTVAGADNDGDASPVTCRTSIIVLVLSFCRCFSYPPTEAEDF